MSDQCVRCGQKFPSWTSVTIPQYCPLCLQAFREALGRVIVDTEKEKLWLDFTEGSDDER